MIGFLPPYLQNAFGGDLLQGFSENFRGLPEQERNELKPCEMVVRHRGASFRYDGTPTEPSKYRVNPP